MNRCSRHRCCILLLLLPALTSLAQNPAALSQDTTSKDANPESANPEASDRPVDFVNDVQPILREHCIECHSNSVAEGGLNLAVGSSAMKGGEHGAVIVAGKSGESMLIRLVSGADPDRRMPPVDMGSLSQQQIGVLRAWIDEGATWPQWAHFDDPRLAQGRAHWAFQRLQAIEPTGASPDSVRPSSVIDSLVARKRQAAGLTSSPAAPAATLVRRLYFDLHGLPPTPDQIRAFVAADRLGRNQAVHALVDQLLESHHYGERWARHWLDVARYAESDGQESDRDRPFAYRFRDFVIDAFNENMPFDQFVRWQIAGDEYQPDVDQAVAATGFLTAGPSMKLKDSFLERERLFNRYNELDDIVSTVGTGLLGLTVGCARCHDHKYDAFSSREYYQLLRVFHSGDRVSAKLPSGEEGFFFQDFDSEVRTTWLFRRSDFYDREIEVSLAFPAVLSAKRTAKQYWDQARHAAAEPKSTLQRRALADWITDVEQGGGALLARVFVNRIWQHHFGHGLVRTESDFGVRGDLPTHPELLEYLVADFVAHGWDIKRLQRHILGSQTWQQGRPSPAEHARSMQLDPQNRLLWKMDPRKLEAEVLRDSMLAISGQLNLQTHGPGFKPYIPPEANLARNIQGGDYPKDAVDDASTRRRSIYMFHKRLVPYPMFQAFDRPDLMVSCAQRQDTTVAPQALALLNDRFVRAVAVDFARRLVANHEQDRPLVNAAFELALGRTATKQEAKTMVAFIDAQTRARTARDESDARLHAIADCCQSIFALNEFMYVD